MIGIGLGMVAILFELTCGFISKDDSDLRPDEEDFKILRVRRMSRVMFAD